jgi:GH18 family chitinase
MKKTFVILLSILAFYCSAQAPVVGGYFPYWRTTAQANFESYNYNYYAFIFPTSDGGIERVTSRENNMQTWLTATDTVDGKRLISIGSTGMPEMAMTDGNRKAFADTLRKFCRYHGFDGIDMDWEAIANATDSSNFTALMKDIRNEMDSTNLEFVITIGSGDYWLKWYANEALQFADFLQIMIYDQTGTWAGSPYGNHSSFDHFKAAETYWLNRGFSRDQLVMGLPYYGYKFEDETGGLAEAVTYSQVLEQFPNAMAGDDLLFDGTGYYWFNGYDLIQEKVRYAIDQGFKGVFVWEIAQDNLDHPLSLEKALLEELNGPLSIHSDLKGQFSVYPIPASDWMFIEDYSGVYEISNVKGVSIQSGIYESTGLNISGLDSGVYFLKLENNCSRIVVE